MTLDEALDVVVARTGHERYRWLTSDDNPEAESRAAYRGLMVALATGLPTPDPAPTPDDEALRSYVRRHGCCG